MKTVRVVAAILRKDDRIFAARRAAGKWSGFWEFPGGKTEPGETDREALVREIREELNIEIGIDALYETVEYDYPSFHLSMQCFLGRIVSGSPALNVHSDAKWMSLDEIDSAAWLPANRTLLEKIKREFPKTVFGTG